MKNGLKVKKINYPKVHLQKCIGKISRDTFKMKE